MRRRSTQFHWASSMKIKRFSWKIDEDIEDFHAQIDENMIRGTRRYTHEFERIVGTLSHEDPALQQVVPPRGSAGPASNRGRARWVAHAFDTSTRRPQRSRHGALDGPAGAAFG